MTDTPDQTPQGGPSARSGRRKPGLEGMLLPELKQLASTMGLRVSGMRKGQVIEAINAAQQSGGQSKPRQDSGERQPDRQPERQPEKQPDTQPEKQPDEQSAKRSGKQPEKQRDQKPDQQPDQRPEQQPDQQPDQRGDRRQERDAGSSDDGSGGSDDEQGGSRRNRRRRGRDRNQGNDQPDAGQDGQDTRQDTRQGGQQDRQDTRQDRQGGQQDRQDRQDRQDNRSQDSRSQDSRNQDTRNQGGQQRGQRNQPSRRGEPDLQILEDDVLAPCAGILDLLDNYAFVRTSGYLPGVDDVYVSMSMVRRHGLRRGDAVAGQVRQPREGERREKFNPLVRIDSVNGADPEISRNRVDFGKLTPLYPTERLRLETSPTELVGRTLDLLTPLGKGQRGLVLSPAKGGKTTVLQAIAAAVTTNNPECHVMVVLVDERPEEVTDYQRSIKGEVISSTFDRPPSDHTLVAELALERAKRLVELGHDVVVLLDGLTRLARAHNAAAPSSSRNLVGGLDPQALHQSKKFFGAARNVENGGSLSIVATASVGSSSPTDAAILEEFEGTENMELWLRRELAEPEVFPAVDVLTSGTRHEELLLADGELAATRALRRSLAGLDRAGASVQLAEQLRGTTTNLELLRRTSST